MKPANFPARKLARQLAAQYGYRVNDIDAYHDFHDVALAGSPITKQLEAARAVRTKKRRA